MLQKAIFKRPEVAIIAAIREFAEGKGIPAREVFDEMRKELLALKKAQA